MSDKNHPFYPFDLGYDRRKNPLMATDSVERCEMVSAFTTEQCVAALNNKKIELQKTVRYRIKEHLRGRRK